MAKRYGMETTGDASGGFAAFTFSCALALLAGCTQARIAPAVTQLPCLADPALRSALGGLGGRLDEVYPPRKWESSDRPRRCAGDESDGGCLERAVEEVGREGPVPADWKVEGHVTQGNELDGPVRWAGVTYVWSPRVRPPPIVQLLWTTDVAPDEADRRIAALARETPLVSGSSRPRASSTNRWHRHGLTVECPDEAAPRTTQRHAGKGWYCARLSPLNGELACRRTLEECEADRTKTILDRRWQARRDREQGAPAQPALERPPGPCEAVPGAVCRAYRSALVAREDPELFLQCHVSEEACEEAGSWMTDAAPSSDCVVWE